MLAAARKCCHSLTGCNWVCGMLRCLSAPSVRVGSILLKESQQLSPIFPAMGLPGALGLLKLEQPWHAGERVLQKKQGTVHSSDEMGPHIYHKVIPESWRDMVGPQPHFMVSFFDPDTNASWSSLIFARPGFADCETSDGTHIDIAAALDPRDAAATAGMMKPGIMVGALAIDFMSRRRNRFNGVIRQVHKNGHFSIRVRQAFGNCPKYITRRRVRKMGKNLEFASEPVMEASNVGKLETAIITSSDNMYFGTGTAEHGADMNLRGGSPGFVRVLHGGSTICWPDYTGNGFYMSLGNVQLQKFASLVFVDWDATGHGVQVAGSVCTVERSEVVDAELLRVLGEEPQALRLVVMSVKSLRSIPRYSPHVYEKVELSPYNPRPKALGPEYLAVLQWVRQESRDVRTFEFQLAPLPKPGSIILKPGQHVRLALPALGTEASPAERTWTVTSSPQWLADHGRFQISVKLKRGGLASTWLHKLGREEMKGANIHFLGFSGEFGPQLDPSSGELRSQIAMPRHSVFLTAGIGLTPAVAALTAIAESGPRPQTLTIFYSVRELSEAAFLELLASAGRTLVQLRVTYRVILLLTGPDASKERRKLEGMLRQNSISFLQVEAGRLSTKVLTDHLPAKAIQPHETIEAFICGPAGFDSAARDMWTAAGFSSSAIRSESFAY